MFFQKDMLVFLYSGKIEGEIILSFAFLRGVVCFSFCFNVVF